MATNKTYCVVTERHVIKIQAQTVYYVGTKCVFKDHNKEKVGDFDRNSILGWYIE